MHSSGWTGHAEPVYSQDPDHQAETLDDLMEYIVEVMDLLRNPNGDDTVHCGSMDEIRQAEASNQVGPYLPQLENGDVVRIQYGNGQTEVYFIVNRFSTLPAIAIPGTCE